VSTSTTISLHLQLQNHHPLPHVTLENMPKQRRIERKAAKAAAKAASVLSKTQQVLHSRAVAGKGCPVWTTPLKEQQSMFFSKLHPGKHKERINSSVQHGLHT
jgi:hypothetical protein